MAISKSVCFLSLNEFNLTNKVVLVSAGCVVPHVAGIFVQEHAVHGGSGVRLARRPPRIRDLLQVVFSGPHPLTVAHDVVATGPPALRVLIC